METNALLTRRVAVALQAAAAPLAGTTGKQAQFPHYLITRGPKKQKNGLGELTLAEYAWGFTQLIKAKTPTDDTVPFMNAHLVKKYLKTQLSTPGNWYARGQKKFVPAMPYQSSGGVIPT